MNIRFFATKTDRLGIRNEVDFVAALGEFKSEFGSHHSATAVCGIACDPDLHFASPLLSKSCKQLL
jgi:hypothetical protein